MRTHLPIGGPELEAAIRATPAVRPYFIEGLVLEETSVLMAAPAGQGKTSVLLTMVAHGAHGVPVFGALACPRPLRFYMFCPERRSTELKERLHRLLDLGVPCNMQNIYVDDGMTGITDFCRPDSCASFFDGLNHAKTHHFKGQNPDIICVEGLHGMSAKALVDPEFARGLLAFNTAVHRNFGASLWYSSHTKKQQRDAKGSLIENDYLGGVLIPAIMTGYYLFERLPSAGEHKSHMKQKKDTVSGLCDELVFTYDPETGLMTLDKDSPQVKAREKFRLYINSCFQAGNTFTHADLMKISAVSQSTVSREIGLRIKEGVLVNTGKAGCNGIYKPLALI